MAGAGGGGLAAPAAVPNIGAQLVQSQGMDRAMPLWDCTGTSSDAPVTDPRQLARCADRCARLATNPNIDYDD